MRSLVVGVAKSHVVLLVGVERSVLVWLRPQSMPNQAAHLGLVVDVALAETSTTTLSIVPPVNGNGAWYSGVTAEALSRPTQMPSPVRQK